MTICVEFQVSSEAAQRVGIQLPRARCTGSRQNTNDLAREAVSCNAVLGRSLSLRIYHTLDDLQPKESGTGSSALRPIGWNEAQPTTW
jgi:hypothetical protein